MTEAAPVNEASRLRFLTFRVDERLYALPADQVAEVIHTPRVARVPQAPSSLLGLANLRGRVLPVATARGLLGKAERASAASDRTIVLDGGAPVALAVDGIEGLVSVDASRMETRQAELAQTEGEALAGAFQADGGGDLARVLDVRRMLDAAFVQRERPSRQAAPAAAAHAETSKADAGERLLSFEVAGQEFALPLEAVREIIPAPETAAAMPHSEAVVLGVSAYRDTLLPLLSLRGLLGLPPAVGGEPGKVVVTRVGGTLVGLVADRMRAILSADAALVEATPRLLAARLGGETRVEAIYRGDGGRRLVSILAPGKLFREDIMARLESVADQASAEGADLKGETRQFVVFRLGGDEFGLPIEAVDEVAPAPATFTRLPKTPKFLEGVINLRGEVLPVIDQRRRFEMAPKEDPDGRRLIVLRTERHRAGVIVDGVSEVLRCPAELIGEAPDLAGEVNRLVNGVINLEDAGRLVLLLDPAELLTRAERGLLDAFQPEGKAGR
ncbi:MAG TPA: chemotaxis protein CheW [Phenylobacterium sp.]|jgi:purine-binding chemotaxis protein CheW